MEKKETHRETPGRAMSQEPKQLFLFLCDAHRSYEGSYERQNRIYVRLDPKPGSAWIPLMLVKPVSQVKLPMVHCSFWDVSAHRSWCRTARHTARSCKWTVKGLGSGRKAETSKESMAITIPTT